MITFQTLENCSIGTILNTFNLSFSDYIISLQLTEEQLISKMKNDSIDLSASVGAFDEGQLIAFVLHGVNQIDNIRVAYNGGTGVIPKRRGQNLTIQMYDFILPYLKKMNISRIILEVITTNVPAIKTYEKVGFSIIRQLNCYSGIPQIKNSSQYEIRLLTQFDWLLLEKFQDVTPSWQNSKFAVEKGKEKLFSIGIFSNQTLIGYLIYNPTSHRVLQMGIDKKFRKHGAGSQLVKFLQREKQHFLSFINIDQTSLSSIRFMDTIQLKIDVNQFEMELLIG